MGRGHGDVGAQTLHRAVEVHQEALGMQFGVFLCRYGRELRKDVFRRLILTP